MKKRQNETDYYIEMLKKATKQACDTGRYDGYFKVVSLQLIRLLGVSCLKLYFLSALFGMPLALLIEHI